MKKSTKDELIEVTPITTETITFDVIGKMPLICNRMSEKARMELLAPRGRKTAAEKQSSIKHDPIAEFRASPYLLADGAPTLIALMASAFKGAMMTAALDLPGAKKAQIGRLVHVVGEYVPIYGVPKLFMAVTRSADMNRTPDIRTRAIIPRWCATVTVQFVTPLLNATMIANLLNAGGITAGVGDWRPEKGKGTYGQFELVTAATADAFRAIMAEGGREAQIAAMENPIPYDDETMRLLERYDEEMRKRGKQ